MNKKLTQGFSLIELVIVIMIIGVLMLVVYPAYKSYIIKSRRAEAKAGLSELAQHQEDYYSDLNNYALNFQELFGDETKLNQYGFSYISSKGECTGCETSEPLYSKGENTGFYAFEIRPHSTSSFYELVARPVGVQAEGEADLDQCYAFYLDSTGKKEARKEGAQKAEDCW